MRYGAAFPVLPGKEDVPIGFGDQIRARMDEYLHSRSSRGVALERVWLQHNPDGSMLEVVYTESKGSVDEFVASFRDNSSEFDTWFFDVQAEISGIDFREPGGVGAPELVGSYSDAGAPRYPAIAFCIPVLPGQSDAGIAFTHEAYTVRASELAASRASFGVTQEHVFLERTPMGDLIVVYAESPDPIASNGAFAASQAPYDRWFKDSLKSIFPPFVDFDQPVPPNRQIWDYVA